MNTTAVIAVAGILGTLAAPYLTNMQKARHDRAAANRAARMQLYVDLSEFAQYQLGYLAWLAEPYRRGGFGGNLGATNLAGRTELFASDAVREVLRKLWRLNEGFDWYVTEENGDNDEHGPRLDADDSHLAELREALEAIQAAVRREVQRA